MFLVNSSCGYITFDSIFPNVENQSNNNKYSSNDQPNDIDNFFSLTFSKRANINNDSQDYKSTKPENQCRYGATNKLIKELLFNLASCNASIICLCLQEDSSMADLTDVKICVIGVSVFLLFLYPL